MINVIESDLADQAWNERLLKSRNGNHNQTKERGIHFERQGKKAIFLHFIDENKNIVGQLLLAKSKRFESRKKIGLILKLIPGLKKIFYYWIYGPIIFDESKTELIYSSLEKYLVKKNCKVFGSTNPMMKNKKPNFSKKFHVDKWATYLIDLKKDQNKIYKNITKNSGRKNIERSIKKGVTIEQITEKSLSEYVKLASGSEFSNNKYRIALDWWKLMQPLGHSGFLAKWNGEIVGGLLFYYFNNTLIEGGVERTILDTNNKLYSQDLIKWKIIEWGVKNNIDYYDLSGYNPYPKTNKEIGIKNYKAKWGGETRTYWFIKN